MRNPASYARLAPYAISWLVLAALMIIGMNRVPIALYTPMDGEWAKWNMEAIFKFGKILDLSPYNMLAGMGSIYLPNLPWLNPGALVLALPIADQTRDIISYVVYGAELALSIVVLARVIGFSLLTATAAAQLHLYILFPPFSQLFLQIMGWYNIIPYFAHLTAVLNIAVAVFLACGRAKTWSCNIAICVCMLVLFISGLTSAPFTFIFATPPYIVLSAALILANKPHSSECLWKLIAVLLCVAFFVTSGLIQYYLGTVATVARTPAGTVAWGMILSPKAWLELLWSHSLCRYDPRLLLCPEYRGSWIEIAGVAGAFLSLANRQRKIRWLASTLLAYVAFTHLYAYAYQAGWLGPASVLSPHFLLWSSLSFLYIFAVITLHFPLRLLRREFHWAEHRERLKATAVWVGISVLDVVIIGKMLRRPYDIHHFGLDQVTAFLEFTAVAAAIVFMGLLCTRRLNFIDLRSAALSLRRKLTHKYLLNVHSFKIVVLAILPLLAFVHLSFNVHESRPTPKDPSIDNYLRENTALSLGGVFRGYVATFWADESRLMRTAGMTDGVFNSTERYVFARGFFKLRYGETFTETDLWHLNIPTLEEYAEWISRPADLFVKSLLTPKNSSFFYNVLRVMTIDTDILKSVGVRYIITDASELPKPASLLFKISAPNAPDVRLFELPNANIGTYSPKRFVQGRNVKEILELIRTNKAELDQVTIVSEPLKEPTAQAKDVVITIERDGIRVRAQGDGSVYLLLPIQFSHCLKASARDAKLYRANLMQTLLNFSGSIDTVIEFRFGLFEDNHCRIQDAADLVEP